MFGLTITHIHKYDDLRVILELNKMSQATDALRAAVDRNSNLIDQAIANLKAGGTSDADLQPLVDALTAKNTDLETALAAITPAV